MPRRGVPTTLFVADVIRRFVDGWSELGMANLAAEDGRAEGEAGGDERDDEDKPSAAANPIGPPAEEDEAGDASQAGNVEKRGGLFGGFLVHLHGDVAPVVERGLDLASVEPMIGAFPGLHDEGGGEVAQQPEREGHGKDGGVAGDESCDQQGGKEKNKGDGQVVQHHMEVLGLPEGGNHQTRVGRKGGLFQRKTNG